MPEIEYIIHWLFFNEETCVTGPKVKRKLKARMSQQLARSGKGRGQRDGASITLSDKQNIRYGRASEQSDA